MKAQTRLIKSRTMTLSYKTRNWPKSAKTTQSQWRSALLTHNQPKPPTTFPNHPKLSRTSQNHMPIPTQKQPKSIKIIQNQPNLATNTWNFIFILLMWVTFFHRVIKISDRKKNYTSWITLHLRKKQRKSPKFTYCPPFDGKKNE